MIHPLTKVILQMPDIILALRREMMRPRVSGKRCWESVRAAASAMSYY